LLNKIIQYFVLVCALVIWLFGAIEKVKTFLVIFLIKLVQSFQFLGWLDAMGRR